MIYAKRPYESGPFERYVDQELESISVVTEQLLPQQVRFLAAEPRAREGLIVGADGSNWDPGSGQGLYIYYGAAWHKLG